MSIFAHGRRSDVIDLGSNNILKLYDESFPVDKIKAEFDKSRLVYNANFLAVPKPIELTQRDKRTGIIFEKISGISLMQLFQQKPWLYFSSTATITKIHKSVHKKILSEIPNQEEIFTNLILQSNILDTHDKDRLIRILNKEYSPVLCHGDFHHGNLIKTEIEYYIIDWMDAFSGCYLLDVALTAVNAMVSTAPTHIPKFYQLAYEWLKKLLSLDKRYINSYGIHKDAINEYLFLAACIHLARNTETKNNQHLNYIAKLKQHI